MFADKAPQDRFFARVRAFDIACPRCDRLYTIGEGRKGKAYVYDKAKSQFHCHPGCGLKLTIGILAWRMRNGPTGIPEDIVPTFREALRLRELMGLGGTLMDEIGLDAKGNPEDLRHGAKEPVNIVIRGECRCGLAEGGKLIHPACPIHGLGSE